MQQSAEKILDHFTSEQPTKEGKMTKAVEKVTSQVPSMSWLLLAMGSIVASATLAMRKDKQETANFVGLWVPTLLLIGIYNKLVKLEGSDRVSH